MWGYIVFLSTHQALRGEEIIKGKDFAVRLVPVPRSIHAQCGLALRFKLADMDAILRCAKECNLEYEQIVCPS